MLVNAGKGTRKRVWQELVAWCEGYISASAVARLKRDYAAFDTRGPVLFSPTMLAVLLADVLARWKTHEGITKELNLFCPSAFTEREEVGTLVCVRFFRDGATTKMPPREAEQWLAAILHGYVGKPGGAAEYLKRQ